MFLHKYLDRNTSCPKQSSYADALELSDVARLSVERAQLRLAVCTPTKLKGIAVPWPMVTCTNHIFFSTELVELLRLCWAQVLHHVRAALCEPSRPLVEEAKSI